MNVERIFLGWDEPFLETVTSFFASQYYHGTLYDLRNVTVAVPGSRAGRRLLELMVQKAGAAKGVLLPPKIVTAGQLPELLYTPGAPLAGEIQSLLLRAKVLSQADRATLKVIVPEPPAQRAWPAWVSLARQINSLYLELCGARLDFSDVARIGAQSPDFADEPRWEALQTLNDAWLEALKEIGLSEVQSARRQALKEKLLKSDGPLYLLSTADLNRLTKSLLAELSAPISALINAPQSFASHFDEFGCLIPAKWSGQEIQLEDERVTIVQDSAAQARLAADFVNTARQDHPLEHITVGLCDKAVAPFIIQSLEERGFSARNAEGLPFGNTAPVALLKGLSRCLASGLYTDLGSLLRHADLLEWLTGPREQGGAGIAVNCLVELDAYQSSHLQARLLKNAPADRAEAAFIKPLTQALEELFGELTQGPRPINEWSAAIAGLILKLYGGKELDPEIERDRARLEVLEAVGELFSELEKLHPVTRIEVSAAQTLDLVVDFLGKRAVTPPQAGAAAELRGWLELQLDDAACLIITGFNDGFVPQAVTADPFLPDSLRKSLELLDNEARYARDAFALSAILHSRPEVRLTAARRDVNGDPLAPSRLFLACAAEKLAGRVLNFYGDRPEPPPAEEAPGSRSSFSVPKPVLPLPKPISVMSVTSFRSYIECPYRFYLRQVLKLGSMNDLQDELDAMAFGTLLHEVLAQFAKSPVADSTKAQEIEEFLSCALDKLCRKQFGRNVLPAVIVQQEQMLARLKAFAAWQAGWAAEGWRIRESELEFGPQDLSLKLQDGSSLGVCGRIDRVDYHAAEKRIMIFDYKTGDTPKTPADTHLEGGSKWVDLQLPIYHFLYNTRADGYSVETGYILLSSSPADIGPAFSTWTGQELEGARLKMAEVAEAVHAQIFWPPNDVDPAFDPFAEICGSLQLGVSK